LCAGRKASFETSPLKIGSIMTLQISNKPSNIRELLQANNIIINVDFEMHNVYWATINDDTGAVIGIIVLGLDVSSDNWSEDKINTVRLTQCAFHTLYCSDFNAMGNMENVKPLIVSWFSSIIFQEAIEEMPNSRHPNMKFGFSYHGRSPLIEPFMRSNPALKGAISLLGYSN